MKKLIKVIFISIIMLMVFTSSAFAKGALSFGVQGSAVTTLQNNLKSLNYQVGTVDGSFGPKTLQAIKSFQADNGLCIDGIAGPQTIKVIKNKLNANNTTPVNRGSIIEQPSKSVTDAEYELLARLVHAEAGIDNMDSQIGVVNVVFNRIASGKFQSSIRDIIYADQQFSVVRDGSINKPAVQQNYTAVDRALVGENTVGNSIFFWATDVSRSNSIWTHNINVIHSNTVFGGTFVK